MCCSSLILSERSSLGSQDLQEVECCRSITNNLTEKSDALNGVNSRCYAAADLSISHFVEGPSGPAVKLKPIYFSVLLVYQRDREKRERENKREKDRERDREREKGSSREEKNEKVCEGERRDSGSLGEKRWNGKV